MGEKRLYFKILLVKDNSANLLVARMQLNSLGYEPDVVGNGLDALERVPYDLARMDCQMPEMDGFTATRELRKCEAGRKRTPEDMAKQFEMMMRKELEKYSWESGLEFKQGA